MATSVLPFRSKTRVFILTDITNEPDDAQSFCRYLTYANQFDTEGVVATTSVWLRNKVAPEALHDIVDGYAQVVDNLNAHAHPESPYPTAEYVHSVIKAGAPVYGMRAVGDDVPLSEGAELLLQRLLTPDERPLWVLVWGGSNVLASVLHRIRDRPDAAQLRAKLRVYTISDQDDTGAWIRHQWPELFYICSVHGFNQYAVAPWIAMASNAGVHGGADPSLVLMPWLREHIQIGPLGAKYPDIEYGMEGDSPTFLYLVQNGLGCPEEPSWGSWGGRYLPVNVGLRGLPSGHHADAVDHVVGVDGREQASNTATIWRWRADFQNDFAARMQWTLSGDFSSANHHPVISVDGEAGREPVHRDVRAGEAVTFDASATVDPDGDALTFKWYQYREPSALQTFHVGEVAHLKIEALNDDGSKVKVTVPPADKCCVVVREGIPLRRGHPLHIILEVWDNGTPPLTSYRRLIIHPLNPDENVPPSQEDWWPVTKLPS